MTILERFSPRWTILSVKRAITNRLYKRREKNTGFNSLEPNPEDEVFFEKTVNKTNFGRG